MTLPQVVRAEHRGGYRIQIVFNDGTEGTVDFSRVAEWAGVRTVEAACVLPSLFPRRWHGVWPNGADVAPETLHDAVLAARANTTPQSTARIKARRRG